MLFLEGTRGQEVSNTLTVPTTGELPLNKIVIVERE